MGVLDGKVAFITGAARGQGRSHALTLAREGADIIATDLCAPIATVAYPLATPEDLATTVEEVERLGRRVVSARADVRDRASLKKAFDAGIEELGGVDIVLANAGILPVSADVSDPEMFDDAIAVNLTGVFNTVEVAKQQLIDQARGGAIVITSSTGGLKGYAAGDPGALGYVGAKTGVVGLMRSYAVLRVFELGCARYAIRLRCVTGVRVAWEHCGGRTAARRDQMVT